MSLNIQHFRLCSAPTLNTHTKVGCWQDRFGIIVRHCEADAANIHVQVTSDLPMRVRKKFASAGYRVHQLERFGDGRYCNKASQLLNLAELSFDRIVLLDTDTIAVGDLRPFLGGDAVQGKIVDLPIPSLAALNELYDAAGGRLAPELVVTDAASELTFLGNANGGFYAIPHALAVDFANEWQRWVQWLLINDRLLRKEGRLNHVDQIAVAFAVQISKIPFDLAPSNVNYFIHFEGRHSYFDPRCPIALIRYHNTMNVLGLLEPPYKPNQIERKRLREQIARFPSPSIICCSGIIDMRHILSVARVSGLEGEICNTSAAYFVAKASKWPKAFLM